MAEIVKMPKMSDTMTEGVIAAWHKKVGDSVKSGELLAEVETDKATMELESYETGTLLYIGVKEKEAIAVDGLIAIIGKAGEDISGLLGGGQSSSPKADTVVEKPIAAAAPTLVAAVDTSNIKATVIRMPKMSDTMTEGVIVEWHKKVGDKVKSGELLAEVETDKATMELESYETGTLLYIGVEKGKAAPIDGVIAIVGEAGADYQKLLQAGTSVSAPVAAAKAEAAVAPSTQSSLSVSSSDARLKVSPLAKNLAKEKGIDLNQLKGTGENGRIVRKDIETFVPSTATLVKESAKPAVTSPAVVGQEGFDEVPVNQMRKVIARRLSESLFTAPHFSLVMEINMDKAVEARKSMNEFAASKISFNDLVVKATAAAIRSNPKVNSSWLGDKIRYNHHIHIGVAVAVEDGLVVPVVRFADNKSLSQISAEVKDLGAKAKSKKLQPAEMEGNTFTISNLGMFGIDEFTSIINSPDGCILSVGGIKQTAIVKDGQLVIGNIMKVTLSCDHRVVDGAVGSAFLVTLKGLLEDPVRILV